jgi:hypothetical protein
MIVFKVASYTWYGSPRDARRGETCLTEMLMHEEVDGRPEVAPSGPTQPTLTDGERRPGVREVLSPTMEYTLVKVTDML